MDGSLTTEHDGGNCVDRLHAQRTARRWLSRIAGSGRAATAPSPVSYHQPLTNVFLDVGIEGQRYQACVVGSSLVIRTRGSFDRSASIQCAIGRTVIDSDAAGQQAALWFLTDGEGARLVLHLSDAGRRAFALTFGVPIIPLLDKRTLATLCPADYFYASDAFWALREFAGIHPRRVPRTATNQALGQWGAAARQIAPAMARPTSAPRIR